MQEPEGSALTLYGVLILFYRILKLDSVRTVIMDRLSIENTAIHVHDSQHFKEIDE